MTQPNLDDVRPLLDESRPAVSLFIEMTPGNRDLRGPAARLRNLIGSVARRLAERRLSMRECDAVLAPIRKMADTLDFTQRRAPGIALFAGPGLVRAYALEKGVGDVAVVGSHFYLKPLLPMLNDEIGFFILAVSADRARLIEATSESMRDCAPDEMPKGVGEISGQFELDLSTRYNPGVRSRNGVSPGVVKAHAYEATDQVRKNELIEYIRRVAAVASVEIAGRPAPLVVAADPEIEGHLRALPGIAALAPKSLSLNPYALTDRELHEAALECLETVPDCEVDEVLDRVNARLGTAEPNVAIKAEEIAAHARDGRVDAVVVALDETLWGRFDERDRTVKVHGTPNGQDDELLNEIAVATLAKGGKAFALPRERIPRHSLAVALLRY